MAFSALYNPEDSIRIRLVKWFRNNLVALDQSLNTLFGGYPDETLSSRAGKANRDGKRWACVLCRFLDIFDRNHCEKSIEHDEGELAPQVPGHPAPDIKTRG